MLGIFYHPHIIQIGVYHNIRKSFGDKPLEFHCLLNINSNYLKLISACIVAIFLAVSNLLPGMHKKEKKAGKENAHA